MLERFKENIEKLQLIKEDQKVLLAVSGGIDSVTMTYLFLQTNINFSIAHCNFQLRGNESEGDQKFVEELAKKMKKEIFTIRFETEHLASRHNLSIQMAARELRYNWFHEIAEKNNFDRIAIAHNSDDIVETFLLNLTRGTGLKGLTGIKPLQGKIIRPMLFATRNEIAEFIKKEKIEYREDSSNSEVKYHRNLIRHKIIPLFKGMNPAFSDTILHESKIFRSTYSFYLREIEKIREEIVKIKEDQVEISITKLKSLRLSDSILYDILEEYGFRYSVIEQINNSLNSQPGKIFYSEKYVLLKDRHSLIIKKLSEDHIEKEFLIDAQTNEINYPIKLSITKAKRNHEFAIPKSLTSIALDCDLLRFPLKIRRWKKGDSFHPLGLKGKKKLSDFFTDRKISLFEKNKIWVMVSGDKIAWVIGHQIDDRFKITDSTKNLILITLNN